MIISLIILLATMALGLPIYLALLLSGLYVLAVLDVPAGFVIATLYDGVYKFALLAVPFFILAGVLIERTSFSEKLIHYALKWSKGVRGGVPISGVIANEFFGTVSGSSAAATGTVGKILFPVIAESEGEPFALGLLTSAGALAIIMPPSITMVLYGAVVNVSVGKLFLTGIIPALIIGVILSGYIVWRAKPVPKQARKLTAPEKVGPSLRNTVAVISVFLLPVLVLGGIYGGIFTPTESAAVAVVYVVLIAFFILKEINFKLLLSSLSEGSRLTCQIFVLIAASSVFSQALTMAQVPQKLVNICEGLSPTMFLIVLNIVLIFVGMFFDPASAVLVLAPIVAPVARALGIDLIHLGIVFTVNMAIGMFTPPFGLNLFVSQAVFKKSLEEIARSLTPFWVWYFIALAIITFIPALYMWVPNILLK